MDLDLFWRLALRLQVQKGLNDYLETKDPLRVQPFLRKIFEGIDKLEFQPNLEVCQKTSVAFPDCSTCKRKVLY